MLEARIRFDSRRARSPSLAPALAHCIWQGKRSNRHARRDDDPLASLEHVGDWRRPPDRCTSLEPPQQLAAGGFEPVQITLVVAAEHHSGRGRRRAARQVQRDVGWIPTKPVFPSHFAVGWINRAERTVLLGTVLGASCAATRRRTAGGMVVGLTATHVAQVSCAVTNMIPRYGSKDGGWKFVPPRWSGRHFSGVPTSSRTIGRPSDPI